MSKDKGSLIVVSAFGGAGKGTIIRKLIKDDQNVLSISATSRGMREEDIEGKTYFFKTRQEFENMIRKEELLEWVEFCNNYYGTPKGYIESQLNQGKNVILELEYVGALKVKEIYKDSVLIFILPPSICELKNRMLNRGEDDDFIMERVVKSKEEVEHADKYDYIIVNDDLEKAVNDMKNIINMSRNMATKKKELVIKIKEELKLC